MAALGIGAIRIRSMAGCVARRSETVRANSEMQIERHRVDPAGRGLVCELGHGGHDPAPSRRPSSSPASASSLARAALSSSALSPQRLIMSCATRPNVDLRDQSRRLMKSPPGPPMTLGNAEASRVRLIVWCKACGHQVEPDAAEQARRYGAEPAVPEWRERLACSVCGSRDSLHGRWRHRATVGSRA